MSTSSLARTEVRKKQKGKDLVGVGAHEGDAQDLPPVLMGGSGGPIRRDEERAVESTETGDGEVEHVMGLGVEGTEGFHDQRVEVDAFAHECSVDDICMATQPDQFR